jgi:Holliday junction resolvase RusA-like endonuclease
MTNKTFFIPGNVPSSKNGKQWTGRYFVYSKATKRYQKESRDWYLVYRDEFKEIIKDLPKPLVIEFEFVRDSHRKFDYVNPLQTVQDFMVEAGWMEDDNADELIPRFLPYRYDKEKPGVYISVVTS